MMRFGLHPGTDQGQCYDFGVAKVGSSSTRVVLVSVLRGIMFFEAAALKT
jgi:hypothetical protein